MNRPKKFEVSATNDTDPGEIRKLMDVLEANGYDASFIGSTGSINVYPSRNQPDSDNEIVVEDTTIDRDDSGDGDRVDESERRRCKSCGNHYEKTFTRCPECGATNPES